MAGQACRGRLVGYLEPLAVRGGAGKRMLDVIHSAISVAVLLPSVQEGVQWIRPAEEGEKGEDSNNAAGAELAALDLELQPEVPSAPRVVRIACSCPGGRPGTIA